MKKKVIEPTSILVAPVTQAFANMVVCSGATCVCTGNPAIAADLSITTHQKYYINAVDKLIATVEDNQLGFGPSPFQHCKHKKGKDKICTYQPSGIWEIEHDGSIRSIGGRRILTKMGTLHCAKGGTLSIRTSGQVACMEQSEKLQIGEPFGRSKSAMLKHADLVECSMPATSYVSKVEELTLSNLEQLHYGHLIEGNPRALRVQKGDELVFTALTSAKEASKSISWSVLYAKEGSSVLEEGKKGKTIQLHTAASDEYQTYTTKHRAFSWQPQRAGVYLITVTATPQEEGSKTYKGDLYYYLEVVDEATITSLQLSATQEDTLVVGDRVSIALHSDIKLSSKHMDQLLIKVSAKDVHPGHHTAFVFTSRGEQLFKQRGTTLQVIFKCVNVNAYQVEVYKNLVQQTAIPTAYFNVGSSSLLAIFPPVESVRIGSRIVFAARFKNEAKMNPLLVQWRIKVPDSDIFQEHFIKDSTVPFSFSKKGEYIIECVYDRLGMKKKSVQHRVRAVANRLEEITLLPCIVVDSLKERKYKIHCNDRVKVMLGTTIGYQPPTTEPAYVEVQTSDGANAFTRIIQRTFSPLEKKIIRPRQISTDTEIVWTLSYVKGPRKKIGFGLSIYYENPEPQTAIKRKVKLLNHRQANTTTEDLLKPMSTYPIYTQTGRIVLRSNRAQFDFQFEEEGLYQLDVTLNHITKSYEIRCVAQAQ